MRGDLLKTQKRWEMDGFDNVVGDGERAKSEGESETAENLLS